MTDQERIDKAIDALIEHFDTVEILTTKYRPESGGTESIMRGRGNDYARFGLMKTLVIQEEERAKNRDLAS